MSLIFLVLTTLIGVPTVADGDTINLNGQRVRLFGIDAVEAEQRCQNDRGQDWLCGGKATQALAALISNRTITCEQRDTDQYGRMVAICRVDGRDLGEVMVEQGWAVAFRRHSKMYVAAEERAQTNRSGIWAGYFQMPNEFRAAGRARVAQSQRAAPTPRQTLYAPNSGCLIKGNINMRGERIYHLPGTKWYGPTKAEAMFCSEPEAVRAGFRKAIVK